MQKEAKQVEISRRSFIGRTGKVVAAGVLAHFALGSNVAVANEYVDQWSELSADETKGCVSNKCKDTKKETCTMGNQRDLE